MINIPCFLDCSQALERQHQDTSQPILRFLERSSCKDRTYQVPEKSETMDKIKEIQLKRLEIPVIWVVFYAWLLVCCIFCDILEDKAFNSQIQLIS